VTPQRIAVIGCGGAGKSTFASELARRTGLPLVHLDQLYWKPGWVPTPGEEWRRIVASLTQQERWIIDGNYGSTLDTRLGAANAVVFLDMSRWRCLYGILRRRLSRKQRPDAAPGCSERLDLRYVRWVWSYRRVHRPDLLRRLSTLEPAQSVYVLSSRRACSELLDAASKDWANATSHATPPAHRE